MYLNAVAAIYIYGVNQTFLKVGLFMKYIIQMCMLLCKSHFQFDNESFELVRRSKLVGAQIDS
jgi:TRAP-type mannitol/chloroaromatic compound transport system permease large subunit